MNTSSAAPPAAGSGMRKNNFARDYVKFDVEELQRVAAESIGARSCVAMTEQMEGVYNKAFRLEMDTGAVAIGRIPFPNIGQASKCTASEVATMDFVRF